MATWLFSTNRFVFWIWVHICGASASDTEEIWRKQCDARENTQIWINYGEPKASLGIRFYLKIFTYIGNASQMYYYLLNRTHSHWINCHTNRYCAHHTHKHHFGHFGKSFMLLQCSRSIHTHTLTTSSRLRYIRYSRLQATYVSDSCASNKNTPTSTAPPDTIVEEKWSERYSIVRHVLVQLFTISIFHLSPKAINIRRLNDRRKPNF